MKSLILTRPVCLRLAAVVAAGLVTVGLFGGLSEIWSKASRGELIVLQWGGER